MITGVGTRGDGGREGGGESCTMRGCTTGSVLCSTSGTGVEENVIPGSSLGDLDSWFT